MSASDSLIGAGLCDSPYAELRKENERLRKDAERYRWLRDVVWDDQLGAFDWLVPANDLDRVIDAALHE